ncbi:MAG: hypothetical protein P8P30_10300 [Rickettsiales bacterium]|nr:hypothetical protein [Rickettsiales bacterium]
MSDSRNSVDGSMALSLLVTAVAVILLGTMPESDYGKGAILVLLAVGAYILKVADSDDRNKNLSGGVNILIALAFLAFNMFGTVDVQEELTYARAATGLPKKEIARLNTLVDLRCQSNISEEDVLQEVEYLNPKTSILQLFLPSEAPEEVEEE